MPTTRLVALLFVIGSLTVFSGCATKPSKEYRAVQAQIAAITDELVRLDMALQEMRAAVEAQQKKTAVVPRGARPRSLGAATVTGGIYRTPGGFELPSVHIQQALKNAGFYDGAIDGKIGPATRDAIRSFQVANGLEADGVVGRKTWDKLKVYLSAVK